MTIKEQLIQEIEQAPDAVLQELLDFLLRIKDSKDDALTAEESASILAARLAYQDGEYQTLEEYVICGNNPAMSYRIIVPKPVSKQLDRLPTSERQRLVSALQNLSCKPRPDGVKKL